MINKIEILITQNTIRVLDAEIDYNTKKCIINDKECFISSDNLSELKDILYSWDNEYGNSNKLDREEFFVNVISTDGITSYHGYSNYPNNYSRFKEILGDIYGK